MGVFTSGITGNALAQKSGGSSRSSSGAVREISASLTLRNRARFARPRLGTSLRRGEDFGVRFALMAVADAKVELALC